MIWCEELQWRFWWQFVLLVCKSVVIKPFSRPTLGTKNTALFFDDLYINWRFGKNLLSSSKNFFSSSSQCSIRPNKKYIVNISQPYKWLKLLRFKKICLNFILINTGVWRSKLSFNSSIRDLLLNFVVKFKKTNLTRSLVGMFEEVCSPNLLFNPHMHEIFLQLYCMK